MAAFDTDESIWRPPGLPPADLMERDEFRQGLVQLGDRGLTFDAYIYHPQIPQLTAAAEAAPGTRIVLDHLGSPLSIGRHAGKRADVFAVWRDSISALGECPNVYMKVGGLGLWDMGTGLDKADVPPSSEQLAEAWRPWVAHVLATFGPERCMAESNFPVDRQTCSYRTLFNAIKRLLDDVDADERDRVLRGTAESFYGI